MKYIAFLIVVVFGATTGVCDWETTDVHITSRIGSVLTERGVDVPSDKSGIWRQHKGMDSTIFVTWTSATIAEVTKVEAEAVTQAQIESYNETRNRPKVFENGIEIPPGKPLVLNSETNKAGWSVFTLDDGTIKTIQVHASPWKTSEEIQLAMDEVRAKHKADKDKALSEINGQLQKRIENLERLMGLRP